MGKFTAAYTLRRALLRFVIHSLSMARLGSDTCTVLQVDLEEMYKAALEVDDINVRKKRKGNVLKG